MTHNVTLEECKAIVTALAGRLAIVYDEKLYDTDKTSYILHGLLSRWREVLPNERKEELDVFYSNARESTTTSRTRGTRVVYNPTEGTITRE